METVLIHFAVETRMCRLLLFLLPFLDVNSSSCRKDYIADTKEMYYNNIDIYRPRDGITGLAEEAAV